MSRTFTEEEISELKEAGFAASGTSRSRILSVLDLLVRFTDERTGISASEIARVIGICSERPTSENAILKDLHQISESMPMGIRMAIPGHGENVGFRAVNKPLSSEEAILISDVLGTSSFIGEGRKDKISSKVLAFSSDYDVDESVETVFVDRKAGRDTDAIFNVLHAASRAIRMNERLAFKKQVHLMNGSTVKIGPYEEDPVAIVFSFGRYYLESMHIDEGGSPSPYFYRLDDIADPVVTGKPVSDRDKVEALRTRVVASGSTCSARAPPESCSWKYPALMPSTFTKGSATTSNSVTSTRATKETSSATPASARCRLRPFTGGYSGWTAR